MAIINVLKNSPTLVDEYILRPSIGMLSRKLFGNNAGMFNNILGDLSLSFKTDNEDCKNLLNNGFVRFDEIIPHNEVIKIKKIFKKKFLEKKFKPCGENELKNNSLIYEDEKEKLIEIFNEIKKKI